VGRFGTINRLVAGPTHEKELSIGTREHRLKLIEPVVVAIARRNPAAGSSWAIDV
jgi:hypothetical protein